MSHSRCRIGLKIRDETKMRSMSSKTKMKGSFWKRCRLSHYALCYTVCIVVSAILVWANQRNAITFSNQWENKHYTGMKFFGQDTCQAVTDPLLDYFTMRDFLNLTEHITTYYPALPIKCPSETQASGNCLSWPQTPSRILRKDSV